MDLQTAQTRIYRWAERSPLLEDKLACDTVFAVVSEWRMLVAEVGRLRAERGIGDDDDTDATPVQASAWRADAPRWLGPAPQRTEQED